MDLSACTQLKNVHIYVHVYIPRQADSLHDLMHAFIHPLELRKRTTSIETVRISLKLHFEDDWLCKGRGIKSTETWCASFDAAVDMLCAACAGARRAGSVQDFQFDLQWSVNRGVESTLVLGKRLMQTVQNVVRKTALSSS